MNHLGCGLPKAPLCVSELQPWEAALLAGIIQSPTAYDPVTHPAAAKARRNLVLAQMLEQGYLTRPEYEESISEALPAPKDIAPPEQPLVDGVDTGYFDSWVEQQVIDRYHAALAYDGGLQIRTTLNLELQRAAENAANSYLASPEGPSVALVAIENSTGKVRAMVGGREFNHDPFNLVTEGERQPGSAFKAFDLAAALEDGISPDSVWSSREKVFRVPRSHELFVVHNDENAYTGENTLIGATAYSDNSIYAEVGLKVGTARIARIAREMGITTPLSTNPAMTIGGLEVGVTPLDMAHAYETIARDGRRVGGTLGEPGLPVGIEEVQAPDRTLPNGGHREVDRTLTNRVLPASVATTETEMLETVLQYGTARAASLGQFAAGKTGTTSNYGDAWFVGWDHMYTVAVWVGYPNRLVPMTTQFNGGPVLGGTFPALIWHGFMVSAMGLEAAAHRAGAKRGSSTSASGTSSETGEATSAAGAPARRGGHTSATPTSPSQAPAAQRRGSSAPGRSEASPTGSSPPSSPSSPASESPSQASGGTHESPSPRESQSAPAPAQNTGGAAAPPTGAAPAG